MYLASSYHHSCFKTDGVHACAGCWTHTVWPSRRMCSGFQCGLARFERMIRALSRSHSCARVYKEQETILWSAVRSLIAAGDRMGEVPKPQKLRVGVTDIQWDAPDQVQISGESVRNYQTNLLASLGLGEGLLSALLGEALCFRRYEGF